MTETLRESRGGTRSPDADWAWSPATAMMCEHHFGLGARPFSATPDIRFHVPAAHDIHLDRFLGNSDRGAAPVAVITGQPGTGKTAALVRLRETAPAQATETVFLPGLGRPKDGIAAWLIAGFGDAMARFPGMPADMRVSAHILRVQATGKRVLILIDEAHLLTPTDFAALARITHNPNGPPILLALGGLPELADRLAAPESAPLAARISTRIDCAPLDAPATAVYLRDRTVAAGGPPDLFTGDAAAMIHHQTGGIPRLVNLLARLSLVCGFASETHRIDRETVATVLADARRRGTYPRLTAADPADAPMAETPVRIATVDEASVSNSVAQVQAQSGYLSSPPPSYDTTANRPARAQSAIAVPEATPKDAAPRPRAVHARLMAAAAAVLITTGSVAPTPTATPTPEEPSAVSFAAKADLLAGVSDSRPLSSSAPVIDGRTAVPTAPARPCCPDLSRKAAALVPSADRPTLEPQTRLQPVRDLRAVKTPNAALSLDRIRLAAFERAKPATTFGADTRTTPVGTAPSAAIHPDNVLVTPIPKERPETLAALAPFALAPASPWVVVHHQRQQGALATEVLDLFGARGLRDTETREIVHDISSTNVRFYFESDRPMADRIANMLSAAGHPAFLRDFTGFGPLPARGTIEVWLAN